ncbi:hypothetical protein ACFRCI_37345 [Streptomyces sp. NPDC056638]|uniref:hypothetical protein n=1 Tax=Streptomyces sp. NPDC056638 TaxID=3345887 RepID=UPI0036946416
MQWMGADHPRRIVGHFTDSRTGKDGKPASLASDIPRDKVTRLNYAFAHVDGGTGCLDTDAAAGRGTDAAGRLR